MLTANDIPKKSCFHNNSGYHFLEMVIKHAKNESSRQ